MGSITLNKPSGGQLTLSPEDGATNETVTIPSVGVGKVLQVAHYSFSDFSTTTSTSFVTANGSAFTFTPVSASSTLVIEADVSFNAFGAANNGGTYEVVHDGIVLNPVGLRYEQYGSTSQIVTRMMKSATTAAGSTSPRTVYIHFAAYNSGTTVEINAGGNFTSSIKIMEVAQ